MPLGDPNNTVPWVDNDEESPPPSPSPVRRGVDGIVTVSPPSSPRKRDLNHLLPRHSRGSGDPVKDNDLSAINHPNLPPTPHPIIHHIAIALGATVVLLMLVAMVFCLVVPFVSKMMVGSLGASMVVLMGLSVAVMAAAACVTGYYFYRFILDVVGLFESKSKRAKSNYKDDERYQNIKTGQRVTTARSFELEGDEAPAGNLKLEAFPAKGGEISFSFFRETDDGQVVADDSTVIESRFYHFRQTRARIRQTFQSMGPRLRRWWQRRRLMAGYVVDEQNHDQWGWFSVENQARHQMASARRWHHAFWLLGLGVLLVAIVVVVPMASLPVTAGTAGLLLTQHFHWLMTAVGLAGLWLVAMMGHQQIDLMKPIHQPKLGLQSDYAKSVRQSKSIYERRARIAMVLLGIGVVLLCAFAPPLAVPILSGTVGYFLEATAIWVQLSAVMLLTAFAMQVLYTAVVRPLISAWVRAEHRALDHPGAMEALGEQNPIEVQSYYPRAQHDRIQYVQKQQDPYLIPSACLPAEGDLDASVHSICEEMMAGLVPSSQ